MLTGEVQRQDLSRALWKGLQLILDHPWFGRVWIIQEVANSRRANVYCGNRSVSSRVFALAPVLLRVGPTSHCQYILDIMPDPSRVDSWWSYKRDLYTFLLKFRGSKASNAPDMVYALLGISSDAAQIDYLRADYTKSTVQVIGDASLFIFQVRPRRPLRETGHFLVEFSDFSRECFSTVVRNADAPVMSKLLQQRGNQVLSSCGLIKAIIHSKEHGPETLGILLKQRGQLEVIYADEDFDGVIEKKRRVGYIEVCIIIPSLLGGFYRHREQLQQRGRSK
ncbi:hypothetical protein GQ43DRAFT_438271 [Delitschia confertaspora ATCC 74209]|uniref:Heterokaryon incompatibility domain-containing protein n=1 Tax=Delitschia confertaspora ATCC 74209 TaxID=1513339 RepID=A0A9P4MSE7_9PLEO|nr:hypothetical protein GQ43DRAFT_438271 [Delitschia confertaspora ATCC 74209]